MKDEVQGRNDLRRSVLDALNAVAPAVENLSVHQEQCDRDGVMVKVSRQALDEVLNAVNEVAMQSAITTSPASPVAQEPVARLCGYCKTWNSKPCGEQCYLQPSDPVWTSPPATPAGLGADEIAQIIATKCFDPRVIDSSGKPFWKKSQWREAQQAANAILALLSRS